MSVVEPAAPPGWKYETTTTTDGGHAKAELALRFLEFNGKHLTGTALGPENAKNVNEILLRCWVIISEYFRP